ncbi:hypothetical protein E3N88_30962 [Mikania micrantha]|uniref:Replication protein A subunit n=1 Tax=Mikania micrantha TaxID=192012 RepID=A0A5N6MNN5_9ASTR|nr:hypothetical protein E3N88_30962 [Mikania micrantha]
MAVKLTEGAISMICTGKGQPADVKPVIQVLDIRNVQPQTASSEIKERYRLLLSDGSFYQQGMLATQLNDLVRSQQLQRGSIVQLNEFVTNTIRDRMIIIIIGVHVILSNCDIIGDAKQFIYTPGSEPSTLKSPEPMQSINQPTRNMGDPQNFTGSVPRPNFGVNSPNYPPKHENNAGLHSYATSHAPTMLSRPPANSYTHPVQPTHNQPPPMYMNRGPTAKNEAPPRIIPISALNPYQGRWTIKARVTAKTELRHYNNAKGEGKVFSFDLLDLDGGEIRTTCFNAVADQFYDQIEAGKVYFISKGNVKPAQKAFNHLKNDHEITLDYTSTILPCLDDDCSIPQQQFHFRTIAEIENLDNNTILDIIGVVYSIRPSMSITRKNNTETLKRTLSLKDMSGRSVEVTFWGNFCNKEGQTLQNMCDSGTFPVMAIKSARVDLYDIRHEEQDEERFTEIVRNTLYTKYIFKLKVKEESFGDEQRVKSTVVKVDKIKASSDANFLLDLLKKEDPKIGISLGTSAPLNNFMGSVATASGVSQQTGLPTSEMGQYGNQYGGSRLGVSCNSCGGAGHNAMNCPSAVNCSGGRFSSMPSVGGNSNSCYKCHQPGHWAKDCPGVNNVSTTYGGVNAAPGRYGSASGQYVGGY